MVKVNLAEYERWTKKDIERLKAVSLSDEQEIELDDENSCPHIRENNEKLIEAISQI